MNALTLPWRFLGRPVKPVSFGIMLAIGVLTYVAFSDRGILGSSPWADVIGTVAFVTVVILFLGWWLDDARLNATGLILSFFIWGFRLWAIILVQGNSVFGNESPYLTIAWMIVTGGAWLLERSVLKGG